MHVTISCLDGHSRKFIHEKLQDDQTSKILYLENFPIYGQKYFDRTVKYSIKTVTTYILPWAPQAHSAALGLHPTAHAFDHKQIRSCRISLLLTELG